MDTVSPIHGGTGAHHSLSLDVAAVVVAVGVLVFGIIVYDAYRTYWG